MMLFDLRLTCTLLAALAGGAALGYAHFASLHRISDDYLGGRVARAIVIHALRLSVMAAALIVLARLGAAHLLAGALGVMASRFVVMRRARRRL